MSAPLVLAAFLFAGGPPCQPATGEAAVPAGSRLRQEPDEQAMSLAVLDTDLSLPVLERCGEWALVRYGAIRAWVKRGDDAGASTARAGAPVTRVEEGVPTRRERAEAILGPSTRTLASWTLRTDLAGPKAAALLAALNAAAAEARAAYRGRFGLDPGEPEREEVALVADPVLWARLSDGLSAPGHAGGGVAAVRADLADVETTRALLLHELTHLMNRRAFRQALPLWLEEGMAEDLAYSRVERNGRIGLGTLRRDERLAAHAGVLVFEVRGPSAALRELSGLEKRDALPSPAALFAATDSEPVGSRTTTYALSGFFVRFLLDGSRAAIFREFLAGVAAGAPPTPPVLFARFGQSDATLAQAFRAWLRARARALP